jgi:hypothetical protein
VTSEGSNAGRDVSYRLSFAGNVRDGVMDPVGNSGYSFGTLQIDLGQHPDVARQMLDSYQRWATQSDATRHTLAKSGREDDPRSAKHHAAASSIGTSRLSSSYCKPQTIAAMPRRAACGLVPLASHSAMN